MYVTVLSISSIGLNSRIRVLSDPRAVNDEIKVRWAVARLMERGSLADITPSAS